MPNKTVLGKRLPASSRNDFRSYNHKPQVDGAPSVGAARPQTFCIEMKTSLVIAVLITCFGSICLGDPLPKELFEKLSAVIREHCPEAAIEATENAFSAKDGTMIFTEHGRAKTGRVLHGTYQKEGPNYKGFLLTITVRKDGYRGPLHVPQELNGVYFPTCFNVTQAPAGIGYYWIHFSYGKSLDPKLKQSIFDALPGKSRPTRFLLTPP